jgi:hypothetical protein
VSNEQQNRRASESALRGVLAWLAGLGTCLVLVMATFAFGPSGFGFGLVIAVSVFLLMARRYRFGLRTFLIVTTVIGVWLGLKVGHDLKLQRAITAITIAGGHLEVHDRRPNFPWGIWAERYNLDFYKLSQPLSDEQLAHLELLTTSSLWWLNLENTGITDDSMSLVRRSTGLEFLSLANQTYLGGQRIPGHPQNRITDAGLAELRGLRTLKGIELSGTDVTDECVTYLLEMPHLSWIYLNGTKVTGAGMARLATLEDLRMLELNGCPTSADGYKELSQLTNITTLGLHNSAMTDQDLEQLNALGQIGILRLGSNKVSNEAVKRFSDAHPRCTIER